MGRPLIYICTITLVVLGILQINLNNRHIALAKRTASYANEVEMRNVAHSAIEATLYKLRDNAGWRNDNNPYVVDFDHSSASVIIEDYTVNSSLTADQLRLMSKVDLAADTVMVNYKVRIIYPQIPEIPAALALTDPDFLPNFYGSFDINGNDESGVEAVGLPGISVIDQASRDKILDSTTEKQLGQIVGETGTPSVEVDPAMDFETMSHFIAQLESKATYLTGQYTSDLGSRDNPGVFMVEDYAKITSNVNGYGILIIKKSGDLDLTSLDLAGTFNFYGLVLLENTWTFDGKGTVAIHGSVMMGSPEGSTTTTIDLGGNLNILYNSSALNYAREAAKQTMPATFDILDIYE
ncbi:hypothetical protein SAMN05443144_111109 [Fodinibius roseus]|uniref:Uncharacterized protein n=1 Tax=Fodinibius roseus TaxID=1194090 RepID=A0A1M5DGS3_9BACT|nr:hypothetical protein [Fodinibius roseus]SHF66074.1 hypothetical protein SAMN05443144_111109 [Fodinibius roseus]